MRDLQGVTEPLHVAREHERPRRPELAAQSDEVIERAGVEIGVRDEGAPGVRRRDPHDLAADDLVAPKLHVIVAVAGDVFLVPQVPPMARVAEARFQRPMR